MMDSSRCCFHCGWVAFDHRAGLIKCESPYCDELVFFLCDLCFESYVYEGGFVIVPVRGRVRAALAAAPAVGPSLRAV